jgi:hypothetical protein
MTGAIALSAVAAALLVGGLVGWVANSTRRGATNYTAVPTPPLTPLPVAPPAAAPSDTEDRGLAQALIAVHDLPVGADPRRLIREDLAAAGIAPIDVPAGAAFDPTVHKAVQTVPAPTPDRAGGVAEQVRPGWRDQYGVIRFAEVAVYAAPAVPGPA